MIAEIILLNIPNENLEEERFKWKEEWSEEKIEHEKEKAHEEYLNKKNYYHYKVKFEFPAYKLYMSKEFKIRNDMIELFPFFKNNFEKVGDKKGVYVMKITGASLIRRLNRNDIDFEFGEITENCVMSELLIYSKKFRKLMLEKLEEVKLKNE